MTGADRQTGSAWDQEERVYKVSTATWYFLKIPFAKGTQSTDAPGWGDTWCPLGLRGSVGFGCYFERTLAFLQRLDPVLTLFCPWY